MLRLVIQNEELPNSISMKFNKVQDFKPGDLENFINILEYRAILIEKCKSLFKALRYLQVKEGCTCQMIPFQEKGQS